MKYKVHNTNENFGDALPEYFDTMEEAEAYREEVIEQLIQLHSEEVLRNFYESEEGEEAVAEMENEVIDNELRQEAKEAICIDEDEEEDEEKE